MIFTKTESKALTDCISAEAKLRENGEKAFDEAKQRAAKVEDILAKHWKEDDAEHEKILRDELKQLYIAAGGNVEGKAFDMYWMRRKHNVRVSLKLVEPKKPGARTKVGNVELTTKENVESAAAKLGLQVVDKDAVVVHTIAEMVAEIIDALDLTCTVEEATAALKALKTKAAPKKPRLAA